MSLTQPNASKKKKPKIKDIVPLVERFPTVFDLTGQYESGAYAKTVVELQMMGFSAAIRSKPDWWKKIKDKKIKHNWITDARKQGLPDSSIDYALDELEKYYVTLIEYPIVPSPVDGVYQADQLISNELRQKALIEGARVLENVPEHRKDWHPNSNKQVLDLVHPSLYCYVKGVSRVISRAMPWYKFLTAGEVEKEEDDSYSNNTPGISAKYQWLPTHFKIAEDGKVTIESYINNLMPKQHKGLYDTIGSIFERFIPLFNKTLTDALNPIGNRVSCGNGVYYDRNEGDFSSHAAYEDWKERNGPSQPVFEEFKEVRLPNVEVDLRGRTVQVIVKMANIILTPDRPIYEGGVWHVEGMENERIIATGIYYYTCENITESELGFRISVREPTYEQDDRSGIEAVYGLRDEGLLVQEIGSVITQQDRCVVFPNLYQHKVAPFQLADPTKPGARKILCFFLVDPATPILSTALVPPQQKTWIFYEKKFIEGTYFSILPPEILHMILDLYEEESLEAAKKHREKLMAERKFYVDNNHKRWERPFSLCEH